MNLFDLSIRSVLRKPVKNILLLFIVFVAASFIYAGFACKNASIQTQDKGRQAVGASFRMERNDANQHKRIAELSEQIGNKDGSLGGYHQKQLANGAWMGWADNTLESLSYEDIQKIGQVEGIGDYNVTTVNTLANPVNFKRIEDADVDQSSDALAVSLRGERQMEYDFDVQNGNIAVNDGRMITQDDKDCCVISRELAKLNRLKLGDKLEFNNRKDKKNSKIYTATIVGIYDTVYKMTPIMQGDSYRSENIIFTDLRFPEKPQGCENEPLYEYATFWVEDVDEYENIKEKIQKVDIKWEEYDLLDNLGMSDTMAQNFHELQQMSTMILFFVLISSVLILMFIFLFWLKNRIHEMGVLLAIGKKKMAIVLQVLLEGIFVGTVAFVLATFAAPMVSNGVAGYLAGSQEQMAKEKQESEKAMLSGGRVDESKVMGVSVDIGADIIFASASAILGIIVISITGAGIYVACQKPKNILSKMS